MACVAACSSPQPVKTVTAEPLPAVTVTATATPVATDALTSLDAWTVCYGFLTRYTSRSQTDFVIPGLRTYDPRWVTASGAVYKVQVDDSGVFTCDVTGTVGAPNIVQWSDGH